MKHLVKSSIDYSLGAQATSLLANFYGLSIPLAETNQIVKEILGLETGVQIIELIFYIWYRNIVHGGLFSLDVTRFRYYDWILTTPMMLFSTLAFYAYLKNRQENEKPIHIADVWNSNKGLITAILALNAIMLLFGYLQEIGVVSLVTSTLFGYLALCGSFYGIYEGFVKDVDDKRLFYFMFIVWSFYGVAAMLPNAPKNISYNVLDLVAKNFYGLYLTYYIYSLDKEVVESAE